MPLHTTTTKAFNQLVRRDPEGVQRYRAELRYFHVPQRHILGMTTAYAIADEIHDWSHLGATAQQATDNAAQALARMAPTPRP
ncbi:hypothetical protein [Streptomyces anulatus]|uniref:Uncharacterized protein n=1 Tax=Streptomyces anulatus TaxID=1892 RepID=A0ABZ1ZNB3_STRAQ|nr:hypothetical protein [Streptomyces anulatus]